MSTTTITPGVRVRALTLLYLYTIAGAGVMGVWIVLSPSTFLAAMGIPASDPYLLGVVGTVYAAFGICAALGLHAPSRFAPVFVLQLAYKTLWLILVFVPHAVRGDAPDHAWWLAVVFASYVALDLVALPFRRLFSDDERLAA